MEFLILALATWRLASMLSTEEGPFDLFAKFRHVVGVRYDEYGVPYGTNTFSKGVLCVWCCSMWFAVLWTVLYFLWEDSIWLAFPFALSAGAIVVEQIITR